MNRFPHAKKLGVTAITYWLSVEGFTGLFEILLTSWDIKTFIKKGYLSPSVYYSIVYGRYIDLVGEVDLSLHMHVSPPIKYVLFSWI